MIRRIDCPECDTEVQMGLPNGATIERISAESMAEPSGDRAKVRELACPVEHRFYVLFIP